MSNIMTLVLAQWLRSTSLVSAADTFVSLQLVTCHRAAVLHGCRYCGSLRVTIHLSTSQGDPSRSCDRIHTSFCHCPKHCSPSDPLQSEYHSHARSN
ncbi:hypothetical protein EDC04DRAFT_2754485 [Pisolithus marmoratus]|nr:hypothetical protein EDC04DRAFT_2754485 [Pisolithus marmoratus]